jgi:hypothetical protein
MPRFRNQNGSVFQYQTFDQPYKYQTFDRKSCQFSDHPIVPPEQIHFARTRFAFADDSEKSGNEADDAAKDEDTTPPTPEPEPIEIRDLGEPAADPGRYHRPSAAFAKYHTELTDPEETPEAASEDTLADEPVDPLIEAESAWFTINVLVTH